MARRLGYSCSDNRTPARIARQPKAQPPTQLRVATPITPGPWVSPSLPAPTPFSAFCRRAALYLLRTIDQCPKTSGRAYQHSDAMLREADLWGMKGVCLDSSIFARFDTAGDHRTMTKFGKSARDRRAEAASEYHFEDMTVPPARMRAAKARPK